MLLDIHHLIELLRSSAWTWSMESCERLLTHLGLQEAGSAPGRRDFRAPSGLTACLYSASDGSPTRIEFPIEVPAPARAAPEHVAHFMDVTAWPLKVVLGEPTAAGDTPGASRTWALPAARMTIEGSGGDRVSLIVTRPS